MLVRWGRLFDSIVCCVARVAPRGVKQKEHIQGLKRMTEQNKQM